MEFRIYKPRAENLQKIGWNSVLYLAIKGTEKDLKGALASSSRVSKIVEQALERGKPIILFQSREEEWEKKFFDQYSSFVLMITKRENLSTRWKILCLKLERREKNSRWIRE